MLEFCVNSNCRSVRSTHYEQHWWHSHEFIIAKIINYCVHVRIIENNYFRLKNKRLFPHPEVSMLGQCPCFDEFKYHQYYFEIQNNIRNS